MQGGFHNPGVMTAGHPNNGGQIQDFSQQNGSMTPGQPPIGGEHRPEMPQPSLPPEQQRIVSLAFQTVNLSTPQKQAVNLIFENKNKSAEGVNLAAYAVLNQQQQAAFRGAYNKLVMLAQNGQLPMQPNTQQPNTQQPNTQQIGTTSIPTATNNAGLNSGGGFALAQPTGAQSTFPTTSQSFSSNTPQNFPTTTGQITGFSGPPFDQGVTNTGLMTSPFGLRGADQI